MPEPQEYHQPVEEYLETILGLSEEGVPVIGARIAERLERSAPSVSQMLDRLVDEGYVTRDGRRLSLTERGRALGEKVVRKHRLAERLLVDVIGLEWYKVHREAGRWEHVISDDVERRLVELLGYPVRCPHGNVIPGLAELGVPEDAQKRAVSASQEDAVAMTKVATAHQSAVIVRRISEQVQSDPDLMLKLKDSGIQPGRQVTLCASDDCVRVTNADESGRVSELSRDIASHVFVTRA
jgi:DtxR family Mn-dependent transcriptional regulator